jgi:hypothetical protein
VTNLPISDAELARVIGPPVHHCPSCGQSLSDARGFVQEYWTGPDRNFLCWCPECLFLCTVVVTPRITSHEPEH